MLLPAHGITTLGLRNMLTPITGKCIMLFCAFISLLPCCFAYYACICIHFVLSNMRIHSYIGKVHFWGHMRISYCHAMVLTCGLAQGTMSCQLYHQKWEGHQEGQRKKGSRQQMSQEIHISWVEFNPQYFVETVEGQATTSDHAGLKQLLTLLFHQEGIR